MNLQICRNFLCLLSGAVEKNLKLLILTVAVWLLVLSSCSPMTVSKRGRVKLCGSMLTQALNLLCAGHYYDPEEDNEIEKRHIVPQAPSELYPGWISRFPSPRYQPYFKYAHHYLLPFRKHQTRGVADDCCDQPCSPEVLLSYCGTNK